MNVNLSGFESWLTRVSCYLLCLLLATDELHTLRHVARPEHDLASLFSRRVSLLPRRSSRPSLTVRLLQHRNFRAMDLFSFSTPSPSSSPSLSPSESLSSSSSHPSPVAPRSSSTGRYETTSSDRKDEPYSTKKRRSRKRPDKCFACDQVSLRATTRARRLSRCLLT